MRKVKDTSSQVFFFFLNYLYKKNLLIQTKIGNILNTSIRISIDGQYLF